MKNVLLIMLSLILVTACSNSEQKKQRTRLTIQKPLWLMPTLCMSIIFMASRDV